jgi:general secretion pathway protein D
VPGRLARPAIVASILALVLSGCAGTSDVRNDGVSQSLRAFDAASGRPLPPSAELRTQFDPAGSTALQAAEPVLIRGSDRTMQAPVTASSVSIEGDAVNLEFTQAPLSDVVQALLGDLLSLSYVIEFIPEAPITLRTSSPIPRANVLPIIESMLRTHGAALVRDDKGMFRVTRAEGLQQSGGRLYQPGDLPQGFGLVAVPLRFVSAVAMAEMLAPVAPQEAIVRIDAVRNLLVLAGSRGQHEAWLEIVRSFDVDFLQGMSLGIFPLEHATVEDVFDTISALMGGAGGDQETAALGAALRLFPLKRLNSLVVVSPRSEHLDTVRLWVSRLDQPALNELEPRLYVYPVQNGSASHLADLLTNLYGGGGGGTGRSRQTDSGVAPGLSPTSLTGGTGGSGNAALNAGSAMAAAGGSNGSLLNRADLGEQVRVVADEHNNALLILAPRRDFRKIEAALRQLDRTPTQIMIEASIIEVTLTGDLRYGLEWTFNNRLGGGRSGIGGLNLSEGSSIAPVQPGFAYSVLGAGGNVQAVLNMLAQRSLLRVLSNPSLLVQDNNTATIHVGDQRPVKSGETILSGSSNITTNIEYRDTGVMLSVTPSTNAGGLVSMEIHQAVTDVGSIDEASGQRSFLQREIKSKVSVRSGETVVMGGLIRDSSSDGRSGVPGLHDLPLVGNLFGSTTEESRRTELLVLITPRVLSDEGDLRAVSSEIRNRMRETAARPLWFHGSAQ